MKGLISKLMIFSLLLCLWATHFAMAGTVIYTYDAAGRLIKADYGQGKTIEYTYDNAGNLLQRQVGSLNITISSNKSSYSAGNTLTLAVSINNLSPNKQVVDAFLGLIFPDGSAYFFDSSLTNLVPAKLDDTRTFTPVRTSLELSPGYQLPTSFFCPYPRISRPVLIPPLRPLLSRALSRQVPLN